MAEKKVIDEGKNTGVISLSGNLVERVEVFEKFIDLQYEFNELQKEINVNNSKIGDDVICLIDNIRREGILTHSLVEYRLSKLWLIVTFRWWRLKELRGKYRDWYKEFLGDGSPAYFRGIF